MTDYNRERAREVLALAEKAVGLPWQCKDSPDGPFDGMYRVLGAFFPTHVRGQTFDDRTWVGYFYNYENATFIAAAPELAALLRAADERVAELQAALSESLPALLASAKCDIGLGHFADSKRVKRYQRACELLKESEQVL